MTMSRGVFRLSSAPLVPCALLLACSSLPAQSLMEGSGPGAVPRIFNTDAAVLESQDVRKDLPCTVTPDKPRVGFDLKFHAGYEVNVPLKDLAGSENTLTMLFRITPQNRKDDAYYFTQKYNVPSIEEDAKGDAYLQGTYDLGEGKYHVDWLMRDRAERVCSFFWDVDASLPAKDQQLTLEIAPGAVQAADKEPFKEEPPVELASQELPLNVKVMVNFAPQNSQSATLQPLDINALVSILRSIAREPRIAKFSIVAFNMQERRVIYRQENTSSIDFPALGDALNSLNLGTVDLKRLSQKNGETDFLANLITDEMKKDQPDAVIFASPKVMLDANIPQDSLKQLGEVDYPVFYMNYNLNPQANPWRDAIGSAVKKLKGFEYTISRPRDLGTAWSDIMSRIVRLKFGRQNASASSR